MNWKEWLQSLKEKNSSSVESGTTTELFSELHQQLSRYATMAEGLDDAPADRKDLIVETRFALRCASECLAVEESRQSVQESAVLQYKLHEPLCRILSLQSPNGDTKCRLYASRMLSNLVTKNVSTAKCVLETIALSPSAEEVSSSIRNVVSDSPVESTASTNATAMNQVNWVDMMLGCARTGNRDALGATVAALHNSLFTLDEDSPDDSPATKFVNNQLIVSTLLRLMLPTKTTLDKNSQSSAADSATEWISLLLEYMCQLGFFPQIYASVGASIVVTPEHVVLLHCISAAVDEWLESPSSDNPHPLGNGDALETSHLFLANQASRIRSNVASKTALDGSVQDSELDLSKSALIVMLEILATSLGSDRTEQLCLARTKIGRDSNILSDVSHDLGTMVDILVKANKDTKARDMKLTEDEQRWITTLVRLMGNLSYRCRSNQDALRELQVPLAGATEERTALHVLLSCTSLAPGCFTLREWAIVALRNVLEGNEANQALVEKLEAQQPLQSTELERMGLRVDMDKRGKVKVVNKETPPQHKEQR